MTFKNSVKNGYLKSRNLSEKTYNPLLSYRRSEQKCIRFLIFFLFQDNFGEVLLSGISRSAPDLDFVGVLPGFPFPNNSATGFFIYHTVTSY